MLLARRFSRLPLCALMSSVALIPAAAQDDDEAEDRVIVVGSYLREPADVISLDRTALGQLGAEDLTIALTRLPANVGAEYNTDSGTQNDTSGTANINLRGLGLDATLVLLDGARMTVSSVAADDGSTFVDLNALTPEIAVAQVDVFADGGSALYGSDALAGVVNVVTRRGFDGFELAGERRLATSYGDDGSDWILEAIAGRAGADWSLTAAASWLDRQSIEGTDTTFTPGTGVSSLGQPGAYNVGLADGSRVTVIDRDCAAAGGIPLPTGAPETPLGTPGFCGLDFAQFFSVVNNEQRLQGWLDATKTFGDVRASAQFVIADNAIERGNSPSLPDLSFPALPAANPGNYFGQDAVWFGRPRGVEAGSARRNFDHFTYRALGSLEGEISAFARDWDWSATLAYSRNTVRTTITDTRRDRFDAAIQGFGGPDCPVTGPNQGVAAGDQSQDCYWFNPFGSGGLVSDPNDPRFNEPVVLDDILGLDVRKSDTDLLTTDGLVTTDDLFALPAGGVAAAFGVQARRETTETRHGEDFNAENFLFILGGPDFEGKREAWAAFAEFDAPLTASLNLQLAGRYDDYDGVSAFSPRAALAWTQGSWAAGASASRSFRAPSLNETASAATTLESLPVRGQNLFRAVTTFGSDDLDPETSNAYTARLGFDDGEWRFGAVAWRYEVDDLIVEESAQAIIAADLADDSFDDPRIELSDTGDVRRVNAAFVNAPNVTTHGLDFSAGLTAPALGGAWTTDLTATYVDEYTLTDPVTGEEIAAEGQRNFANFARSLPQWRGLVQTNWTRGGHSLTGVINAISSYDDDENPGAQVGSQITLDAQYAFSVNTGFGEAFTATLGVINAFDEEPPFVDTALGYDTKVHDPRGRVVYLRLAQRF